MKRWQTLSRRPLIERWWMNLHVDHVRLPNGVELEEFHVIEYPDWACVLCLTESGDVVLVEQYRYGIDTNCPELPAGAIGPGEPPLEAAQRELMEETGYISDDWELIGRCAPEPSKQTNYAHLYLARNARLVQHQTLDESEQIEVRKVKPAELLEMADTGLIQHGVHLATIFWAARKGFI